MPKPQKEHQWLQQLAGEWDTETEIFTEAGKPPMQMKGREKGRMIGGFFLVSESTGELLGMPYTSICSLGYDVEAKQFVGTWLDSFNGFLWHYTGQVDGNTLTLLTKGPCPKKPGTMSNIKEVIELKDDGTRVFTSSIEEPDGSWTKMLTTRSVRRKK